MLTSTEEGALACAFDGAIIFHNAGAAMLLDDVAGISPGDRLQDILMKANADVSALRVTSALSSREANDFVIERPNRPEEWIGVRALPLNSGMMFFLQDVTAREESERQLRRKEQRLLSANRSLRLAQRAAHAAGWEWRVGKSLRWLDLGAARELEALPPAWTEDDEMPSWRELVPKAYRVPFFRALRDLSQNGEASFEFPVLGSDDEEHWLRLDAAVMERTGEGEPRLVSGVTLDITQAKLNEDALRTEVEERRRSEEIQRLLLGELNHRVKNMLATVQSIARQSLPTADPLAPSAFEERLVALSWAYEILTEQSWQGAPLEEIVKKTMAPHQTSRAGRVRIEGPGIWLSPSRALAFALATHELATNALKYGALSNPAGHVSVTWSIDQAASPAMLTFEWTESGGPEVSAPGRRGFGSRLIERSLSRELGGHVALTFPASGVCCRIQAPIEPAA